MAMAIVGGAIIPLLGRFILFTASRALNSLWQVNDHCYLLEMKMPLSIHLY